MNDLTIERMRELEKVVIEGYIPFPSNIKELKYISRINKIPLGDALNILNNLNGKFYHVNNYSYIENLLKKYNCSKRDLELRLEDAKQIEEYEKKLNNNLLQEQKKMIKRMKKN